MKTLSGNEDGFLLEDDPSWYKDAVIYEVHVRAFNDSNADGIGDFPGLTEKLDYLQDLGITAIWLLPFYPSPLKDDGYDIADYTDVHPSYGTISDFKVFLREAHRRGIRVITELVLNHTSDQHAWFQRARRATPGSVWRDFYVWSSTPDKYRDARIIFKDFESSNWAWDPVANAYYWHRFYHHQPDLNFDNPEVIRSLFQVVHFWLGIGVDGMRLDAVPYLYEREGTNCENLPETHTLLKQLRAEIDAKFRNRMLLAEANQWPEDAVTYFGNGDECHMAFHFPVMPRMFMALRMEDRFPILDILAQTPAIPESSQWAMFLRNHDELTLEMVTDEERDYMYRAYAHDPQMRINLGIRRRLATLLGRDWRQIELMNALLFSLPGTPVLYYGDEIGMGDNIYLGDRNAVRTPMHWSADRNAGFSRASPHRLYLPIIIDPESHYEAFNVETQQNNFNSILWWMKRLIGMRKRYKAFGRGTLEFLLPDNHRVLAFTRRYQDEVILVVANLSRFVQAAALDLSGFKGTTPVELFGRASFPVIGDSPYFLTLGPHSFYWFLLPAKVETASPLSPAAYDRPSVETDGMWINAFSGRTCMVLERALLQYLPTRHWFGEKARWLKSAVFTEVTRVPLDSCECCMTQVQADYEEGDPETYLLPLAFQTGEVAEQTKQSRNDAIFTNLIVKSQQGDVSGILVDAVYDKRFCEALLNMIFTERQFASGTGRFVASPVGTVENNAPLSGTNLEVSSLWATHSKSSIVYGDRFLLKLFRKFAPGINPDIELSEFLTNRVGFSAAPAVRGSIEYRSRERGNAAVAVLHEFIANEGDAWHHTLDALSQFFSRTVTLSADTFKDSLPAAPLVEQIASVTLPPGATDLIGPYYEHAKLLGRRTAELHIALASDKDDPNFAPEPFSVLYQRSLYQGMRNHAGQTFLFLRKSLEALPAPVVDSALKLLDRQPDVLARFRTLLSRKINAKRMRIHGSLHLGEILYTGKDFVIIDFEGEPGRALTERRIKRSPVRDVAGMLRSFHYAAYTSLFGHRGSAVIRPEDFAAMEPWVRLWSIWVAAAYLKTYLEVAQGAGFLPENPEELHILLNAYMLERALYELAYELENRPDWLPVPITGINQLLT